MHPSQSGDEILGLSLSGRCPLAEAGGRDAELVGGCLSFGEGLDLAGWGGGRCGHISSWLVGVVVVGAGPYVPAGEAVVRPRAVVVHFGRVGAVPDGGVSGWVGDSGGLPRLSGRVRVRRDARRGRGLASQRIERGRLVRVVVRQELGQIPPRVVDGGPRSGGTWAVVRVCGRAPRSVGGRVVRPVGLRHVLVVAAFVPPPSQPLPQRPPLFPGPALGAVTEPVRELPPPWLTAVGAGVVADLPPLRLACLPAGLAAPTDRTSQAANRADRAADDLPELLTGPAEGVVGGVVRGAHRGRLRRGRLGRAPVAVRDRLADLLGDPAQREKHGDPQRQRVHVTPIR